MKSALPILLELDINDPTRVDLITRATVTDNAHYFRMIHQIAVDIYNKTVAKAINPKGYLADSFATVSLKKYPVISELRDIVLLQITSLLTDLDNHMIKISTTSDKEVAAVVKGKQSLNYCQRLIALEKTVTQLYHEMAIIVEKRHKTGPAMLMAGFMAKLVSQSELKRHALEYPAIIKKAHVLSDSHYVELIGKDPYVITDLKAYVRDILKHPVPSDDNH